MQMRNVLFIVDDRYRSTFDFYFLSKITTGTDDKYLNVCAQIQLRELSQKAHREKTLIIVRKGSRVLGS